MEVLMQALAGVFLQMGAGDADALALAVFQVDVEVSLAHHWQLELADLVALGQVGVEVVLAREHRARRDVGLHGQAELHGHAHGRFVEHGKRTGIAQVDDAGLGVGRRAITRRGTGKDLAAGGELGVDFQPDHDFPFHCAIPQKCGPISGESGRMAAVPVSFPLELVCHVEQPAFLEMRPNQLQTHRQVIDEAGR